ncbi:MAG: hypothetical protein H0U67_05130 [Gemmatimonadetes bacterium]|nr:hypothetical protein [Gemmatimonadota bacterium]
MIRFLRVAEARAVIVLSVGLGLAGCGAAGEEIPAAPPAEITEGDAVVDGAGDTIPGGQRAQGEGPSPVAWTAGRTAADHEVDGVAVLEQLRIARNEGFDRVVFEFGGEIPSYVVEYIDRPVRACGSGHVVDLDGDGWLSIRFTPARAHTEEGQATVTDRNQRHQLPVIRHARSTCDFEANLEWVIGTASPNRYRVMELADPERVVVDIRH